MFIIKIKYVQGKSSCERCGAYIKNIYIITFNDGYSIQVGPKCVKNVLRETNLTKKGCTYVENLMKPIERLRKKFLMWQNMTYETALKKKLLTMVWDETAQEFRNQTEEEYRETKKRMLEYLPKRLKEDEEEMNKVLLEKGKNIRIRQ
ncbi:hypothetical protein [Selenomonas ruminantium]|uniref:hypothetical protein n=1 Tax=Selenomonas ruminantium TaxID=971 RepID=UPI0026E9D34D|nr:hypothetical protein [Selenomonas ruminantium]